MENIIIARLAVSAATYAIDKPYDYLVPESVVDKISPGVRVSVPLEEETADAKALYFQYSAVKSVPY